MKKILAFLLAMMLVLSLAACGGKDTPAASGSEGNTPSSSQQQEQPSSTPDEGDGNSDGDGHFYFADATVDNWAQVLEEQLGISISVPDGWSVSKIEGDDWSKEYASEGDIYIYFDCPDATLEDEAGIQAITDFLSSAFDAIKSKATGDIVGMYDSSKTFDSLPEIEDLFRISPSDCGYYFPLEVSDKVGFEWKVTWNSGAAESLYIRFTPK